MKVGDTVLIRAKVTQLPDDQGDPLTGHPIGDAIQRQRNRERAARDHMRVAVQNGAPESTIKALSRIIAKEAFYGD